MSASVPQPAEPRARSGSFPGPDRWVSRADRSGRGGGRGPGHAGPVAAAAAPARRSGSARASCCSGWSAPSSAICSRRIARSRSNCSAPTRAPSSAHWFGTDPLGRDVLSRVITGARDILIITPLATILGTILGTALGLAMGYLGGKFDLVVGRLVEAFLALPFVIIAFLFVVAIGHSVVGITIIIGLVFTPLIARTVRAAVLVERSMDYVPAARLLGENPGRVMFGEILPNVMPAVVVEFTVRLSYAVFAVATLSFLGFGIAPPTPDWGADIAANYVNLVSGYWWQTLFPALAIASLVVAVDPDRGRDRAGTGLMTPDPAPDPAVAVPAAAPRARPGCGVVRIPPGRHLPGARGGPPRPAGRVVPDRPRRILRAGGRVRVRQVHGRARAGAVPAQQRPGERRDGQHQRAGPAVDERLGAARPAGPHGVDGLPGTGAGAQSVAAGRAGRSPRCSGSPGSLRTRRRHRPRRCCARCRSPTRAWSCGGTRTSCPAGWRSGWSSRWRWPSRRHC